MDATTNIESRLPNCRTAKGFELSSCRSQSHASFNIAEIFKKTPYAAGLKPAGRDVAKDLPDIGIIPLFIKILLDRGTVRGDGTTAMAPKIAENLKTVTRKPHQNVQRSIDRRTTFAGGGVGLWGKLAPSDIRLLAIGVGNFSVNVNLTDKELTVHPSKAGTCATNHVSGTLCNDAPPGGAHENQCYADV